MVISAAVIVCYCTLGGSLLQVQQTLFRALLCLALIVVVVFGINVAGGFDAVVDNAKQLPGYLGLFKTYSAETGTSSTTVS